MRSAAKLELIGWLLVMANCVAWAQINQPVIPLPLGGEPQPTQVPQSAILDSPQCDGRGDVYLRYTVQEGGTSSSAVVRIEPDGSTQKIALDPLTDPSGQSHTFILATGDDSSLHEVARVSDPPASEKDIPASRVEYARFGSDGELRSQSSFSQQFIPSLLVPLPSGSFFAAGIVLKVANEDIQETSVAGIFTAEAKLQRKLSIASRSVGGATADVDSSDAVVQGQTARLGNDGKIYILLAGDHARVAVVSQAGSILRWLDLREPFETGVAHDMWVSGTRLLVVYEGEGEGGESSYIYVLYDTETGNIIRAYRPEFQGTAACFQDGQTLSLLVRQPTTGAVGIASVELR